MIRFLRPAALIVEKDAIMFHLRVKGVLISLIDGKVGQLFFPFECLIAVIRRTVFYVVAMEVSTPIFQRWNLVRPFPSNKNLETADLY